MKRVTFLSRAAAQVFNPPANSVLISIHDISEPQMQPSAGWSDVLYLRFHDTDGHSLGLELFTEQQAQSILSFVQQHQEADQLFVHCHAGESRSGAVAIALSELRGIPSYKGNLPVTWKTHRVYNKFVYRVLMEAAHKEEN